MKKITIYTGPHCNYCDAAKRLLTRNNAPFEEIKKKTGKSESEVIRIMRNSLKPSSFKLWRKRVKNQSIKHRKKFEISRKQIRRKIKKNDYI